jgi:cell pole-organizing protein PopZ
MGDRKQMGDMSKEPSMEEILSSIKRIIAEEGDEAASSPRAPRRGRLEVVPSEPEAPETTVDLDDDILELTPPTHAVHADEEALELPVEESAEADEVLELAEPVDTETEEPLVDLVEIEEPVSEDVIQEIADDTPVPAVDAEPVFDVEAEAPELAPVVPEVLELTHEIDTEETVTQSNAAPSYSGAEPMISVESEVAARHSLSALSSMVVVPDSGEGNTLEELVKSMLKPLVKEWLDAKLPELVEGMVAKEITRITGGVR